MPTYSHFDYYLRSIVTAILALGIIGVSAYDQVTGNQALGPFKDWAGLIIGVYFGSHISLNGSGARRRQATAEGEPVTVPVEVVPKVVATHTTQTQPSESQ